MKMPLPTLLAAVLIASLAGCGGEGGSPAPATSEPVPLVTPNVAIFAAAPSPRTVAWTADTSRAASATIGSNGGSLDVTGADGSAYTLTVPPGALLDDTNITMQPVTSMTGSPFARQVAVELLPDGLQLRDFATLSIRPATPLPVRRQVAFAAHGNGELGLALMGPDPGAIVVKLMHFTVPGVGDGDDRVIAALRDSVPTSAEDRLTQEASALLSRERQALDAGAEPDPDVMYKLGQLWLRFRTEVVEPQVANATSSCDAGKLAIRSVFVLYRNLEFAGANDARTEALVQSIMPDGNPGAAIRTNCMKETYVRCAVGHDLNAAIELTAFDRERVLAGLESNSAGFDAFQRCARFEVRVQSTLKVLNVPGSSSVETTVNTAIPITYSLDQGSPQAVPGSATLSNTALSVESTDCGSIANVQRGDGRASVVGFSPQRGKITNLFYDYKVTFVPFATGESWTRTGCGLGATAYGPSGVWTDAFLGLHGRPEGGQVAIEGFTTQVGPTLAQKAWKRTVGNVTEDTTFTIVHTPVAPAP